MTAAVAPPAVERIRAGDIDLRVLRAGREGEHVLFVHGVPGSADDWRGPMAAVSGFAQAVAIDLPEFGETRAPAGFTPTVPNYSDVIEQARQVLGLERVHLVLHDFGGPIGLHWAGTHPDSVASVTLIDTGILPGYRWHALARIWRTPGIGELFQASMTRWAFRAVINLQEPNALPRAFLDGMYRHYDRRTRRAILRLYRATGDRSAMSELTGRLRELEVPALVIWGEHDAYLPASYASTQRETFPAADVHVLAGSGHWPFVDAAPTVERLLTRFLAAPQEFSPPPDRRP